MICRSCGALIKDSSTRCPHCKLEDPDLYRGRKDSDYLDKRPSKIQNPDHPANRASAGTRPTVSSVPNSSPQRPKTDTGQPNRPVYQPLPKNDPSKNTTMNKTASGVGTVIFWVIILLIFIFATDGCDSFFSGMV